MKNNRPFKIAVLAVLYALSFAGLLFILGLTGFMGYTAVVYLIKSFTVFDTAGQIAGAFIITLIVLAICALFLYCCYRIIVSIIKFSKKYLSKG